MQRTGRVMFFLLSLVLMAGVMEVCAEEVYYELPLDDVVLYKLENGRRSRVRDVTLYKLEDSGGVYVAEECSPKRTYLKPVTAYKKVTVMKPVTCQKKVTMYKKVTCSRQETVMKPVTVNRKVTAMK
jgi:hypothetical protein